jgi:hypothetical protein
MSVRTSAQLIQIAAAGTGRAGQHKPLNSVPALREDVQLHRLDLSGNNPCALTHVSRSGIDGQSSRCRYCSRCNSTDIGWILFAALHIQFAEAWASVQFLQFQLNLDDCTRCRAQNSSTNECRPVSGASSILHESLRTRLFGHLDLNAAVGVMVAMHLYFPRTLSAAEGAVSSASSGKDQLSGSVLNTLLVRATSKPYRMGMHCKTTS